MIKRKNIELSILFGLIAAIILSMARFDATCEELRQNVLRLHIIANSDSAEDQQLKYEVRDEILRASGELFGENTELEKAIATVSENITQIEALANSVIEKQDVDYSATAQIGMSYFENREYDDFTLPAGEYESLIIKLGEGKGKNWWCVVFPTVCIAAAGKGELTDSVSYNSAEVAQSAEKYVIKFKTVEIYEDIKRFFELKTEK